MAPEIVAVFLEVFAFHPRTNKHGLGQIGLLMRPAASRRTHLFNISAGGDPPEPIRIEPCIKPVCTERRDPYPFAPD